MTNSYFRIRHWAERYENNRSRDIKNLQYVLVPNTMDTDGYTALLDHPNGAAHYGAWVAILLLASRSKERGSLVNSEGRPHTARSLSRITRIPAEIFDELLPRLESEELQWIESVGGSPQDGAVKPQDGATSTRAGDTVEYSTSTVEVSSKERTSFPKTSLALVPQASVDPELEPGYLVSQVCEMYAAGGVAVPIPVQTYAERVLVAREPKDRLRLPRYVAWAFQSGRWNSPAKTKSLANLLKDGDWDVDLTQRIIPQARDPASKDAERDAVTARFRQKMSERRMAEEGQI